MYNTTVMTHINICKNTISAYARYARNAVKQLSCKNLLIVDLIKVWLKLESFDHMFVISLTDWSMLLGVQFWRSNLQPIPVERQTETFVTFVEGVAK